MCVCVLCTLLRLFLQAFVQQPDDDDDPENARNM